MPVRWKSSSGEPFGGIVAESSGTRPLIARLDRVALPTLLPALLIAVGIGALAVGPPLLGAISLALGTVAIALIRPAVAVTAILVLFPFQPLAVRVLERDSGVTGTALVIASAWKELALGTVLVVLVMPYIWRVARGPHGRGHVQTLDVLALLLIVLVSLGIFFSPTLAALNQARLMLFPIGLYLVLRVGVVPADRVMNAMWASGIVVAIFGILQASAFGLDWVRHYFGTDQVPIPATFTATFLVGPRASGTLGSPNEFAFLSGACAIIAIAMMASTGHRRAAVTYGTSLFVLLPALALSFSRSALAGCLAGLVIAVALGLRVTADRGRLVRLLSITLAPALLVASLLFVSRGGVAIVAGTINTVGAPASSSSNEPSSTHGPGSSGDSPDIDSSTVGHITSLSEGVRLLSANPFGIGLGNVGAHGLPGEAIDSRYVVESWYLSMGLALGMLGLVWSVVVVMSMALSGTRAAIRRREAASIALVGVAVLTGLVGFVLPTMLEPQLAMLPWALAACVGVSARRSST